MKLDSLSDSQANAEAVARRESAYLSEHYGSRGRRDHRGRPLPRPRGLIAMLGWFEAEWHDQAPDRLHKREVWHDYVTVKDETGAYGKQGGGSRLGAHAWTDSTRRILESPRSADPDEYYLHPLAAALAAIERRDEFMAKFLRAIALAGFQVSPIGLRLGYEESVVMVYADAALERLWSAYRAETPPRPLTGNGDVLSSARTDKAAAVSSLVSTAPDLAPARVGTLASSPSPSEAA